MKKRYLPRNPRVRTFAGIRLPIGVAVVINSAGGVRFGRCVMAYIGGRGKRGPNQRNQITKRFNPATYPSMKACIADAALWRRLIEETWP